MYLFQIHHLYECNSWANKPKVYRFPANVVNNFVELLNFLTFIEMNRLHLTKRSTIFLNKRENKIKLQISNEKTEWSEVKNCPFIFQTSKNKRTHTSYTWYSGPDLLTHFLAHFKVYSNCFPLGKANEKLKRRLRKIIPF